VKQVILFAIFNLVFITLVNSQSLDELNLRVVELYKKGEFTKAIPYAEKSVQLTVDAVGENNLSYVKILNILVILYINANEYQKAETNAIKALGIWKKLEGESSVNYLSSLNILGELYKKEGYFEDAEKVFLKLQIAEKNSHGENTPLYANILNNLADLYVDISRYDKAEPLMLQSKEIRTAISGTKSTGYTSTLMGLAYVYQLMGNYEKSETFYKEANQINRQILGENHPEYIRTLVRLASLYTEMNQGNKAEPLFIQALQSIKKVAGEEHRDYAATLSSLASLYLRAGLNDKAVPLLERSLQITRKIFGENHPYYATVMNNLASAYKNMKETAKAENLYLQAKEIRKKFWGEDHAEYGNSLSNLSLLYFSTGSYDKAISHIIASDNILLKNTINTFSILSEQEKSVMLQVNIMPLDIANSLLYIAPGNHADLARENYRQVLVMKSLALSESRNVLESLRKSNDPEIKQVFNNWITNKQTLARQYSLPVSGRSTDLDKLINQTELLEKELNRKSSVFRDKQSALQLSIEDVQNKLANDEAAIEFVDFRLYDKTWQDKRIYGAYVLRKNEEVKFIPLCDEKQLQQLFSRNKNTTAMVNEFYRGVSENISASAPGDSLYKLIWQPLEPYLKNIHTISYSPSGMLYNISFNALPSGGGQLLMDRYYLNQVTGTRQVAQRIDLNTSVPVSVVLFGDPMFTMNENEILKQQTVKRSRTSNYNFVSRGNSNSTWSSLPGTAEEVKKIQQLFTDHKINSRMFTREAASEDNLKSLSGNSPQVIHIASHGFFLSQPVTQKKEPDLNDVKTFSAAADPLLRSGLVLSGANYTWTGKTLPEGIEDGICTAYEISQMDLSNTELVVLSACETALGDIKGSEGVYGLQRAFKMAGAKKMIVSLWQVPDKETAELMSSFYSHWITGKNVKEAFHNAQDEMRKKYSPFFWAAFVLVE
jgi:CHAT domain-containing protein